MAEKLSGQVCIVTGATRGIGKGIALQLGEAGATVYITGRTLKPSKDNVGGSLEETAQEIENRGGHCIPVQCDHSNETEVEALFDRVSREQNGRLDILVNNAYAAVKTIIADMGKTFWETDPSAWDITNNVGLRNHYYCSVYAARLMVPKRKGLIVNISSIGGLKYLFNVPYGIGKAACDRMASDCAIHLKDYNVAFVSLWPGLVRTEEMMNSKETGQIDESLGEAFEQGESIEYAGKCIVHLTTDPKLMSKSGRVLMSAELGSEYGFTDIDGKVIQSSRSLKTALESQGWSKTAMMVPGFLNVPYWALTHSGSKF